MQDKDKQEKPVTEKLDVTLVEPKKEVKKELTPEQIIKQEEEKAEHESKLDLIKKARSETTTLMDPVEFKQIQIIAQVYIDSHALPAQWDNPAKVVMGIQAGLEMGMKPIEALGSLCIINGTIGIWGKAVTRRLREHGWDIVYTEEVDKCTATITNKIGKTYSDTFTFKEAEESGYTKDSKGYLKPGWKNGQSRKLKLRYGVLSALIKSYIPEVFGPAADIQENLQDFDQINQVRNNVIEGEQAEVVRKTISDEDFKKFISNNPEFIEKHAMDFDFTQDQIQKLEEIIKKEEVTNE
jgi:hypothetical protein